MASGPRPSHHTRPPTDNRPPPSPDVALGPNADPQLLPLFRAVDKDGESTAPSQHARAHRHTRARTDPPP